MGRTKKVETAGMTMDMDAKDEVLEQVENTEDDVFAKEDVAKKEDILSINAGGQLLWSDVAPY